MESVGRQVLDSLLKGLDELATEGLAATIVEGKAVSRSRENLHIATPNGLVAIPIEAIDDLQQLPFQDDPTYVSVTVRRGDLIRHIVDVQPVTLKPFPGWDPPISWPPRRPWIGGGVPSNPIGADAGTTFKYTTTRVCDSSESRGKTDDSSCVNYDDSVPE